jgi:hypothetical protein
VRVCELRYGTFLLGKTFLMFRFHSICAAILMPLVGPLSCAFSQVPASVLAAAAAFGKRPLSEQDALVLRLQQQLQNSPDAWLKALLLVSADAAKASTSRMSSLPPRDSGKKAIKLGAQVDDGLPHDAVYVFGQGVIDGLEATGKPQQAAVQKARVTAALLGVVPSVDRAVASLLRQLDVDSTADRFAAFLTSWRNGTESFYEALQRTAGTKDSVFFYDVMLGDFTSQFVKGKDAAGKKGLQAAHDALHEAFLSYRQYRAFREAVAWSLVLPPERMLPTWLSRYEAQVQGSYSLREQVVMMLATVDYDPRKVVEMVVQSAPQLPVPLWDKGYDPYPSWNLTFQGAQAKMIEVAGNTDDYLVNAKAAMAQCAERVKSAVNAAEHPGKP